ncbi:hypothetical protein H5410_040752, partial [Solanum commersonii]
MVPNRSNINWDHSAQLVEIADALGNSPFGLLHRLSAFSFSIFAFWIIGRYSIALRNCSATRRLLLFIADLIFSFKAQHSGTLGEFKKDVLNSATQDSIMNAHIRLNLLRQRSNVQSKFQFVTHHYQRISSSPYLLQIQVQAQLKCSNVLTQRMIPYSFTMVQQFKALESNATFTLTKKNTMHAFTHSQDKKDLYKACNGAECKCM